MSTYNIIVTWEMVGNLIIEADNEAQAMEIALNSGTPDGSEVDCSMTVLDVELVDDEESEE